MSGTRNREGRSSIYPRSEIYPLSNAGAGPTDVARDQRAKLRSPSERQHIIITPGPASRTIWDQTYSSRTSYSIPHNGRVSVNTHNIRPPTASHQTSRQSRAMLQPSSERPLNQPSYNAWDNGIPSSEHPMRAMGHQIHADCDIVLPSVEDIDANRERDFLRMRRRN